MMLAADYYACYTQEVGGEGKRNQQIQISKHPISVHFNTSSASHFKCNTHRCSCRDTAAARPDLRSKMSIKPMRTPPRHQRIWDGETNQYFLGLLPVTPHHTPVRFLPLAFYVLLPPTCQPWDTLRLRDLAVKLLVGFQRAHARALS